MSNSIFLARSNKGVVYKLTIFITPNVQTKKKFNPFLKILKCEKLHHCLPKRKSV